MADEYRRNAVAFIERQPYEISSKVSWQRPAAEPTGALPLCTLGRLASMKSVRNFHHCRSLFLCDNGFCGDYLFVSLQLRRKCQFTTDP
jgi:hypothetical protein